MNKALLFAIVVLLTAQSINAGLLGDFFALILNVAIAVVVTVVVTISQVVINVVAVTNAALAGVANGTSGLFITNGYLIGNLTANFSILSNISSSAQMLGQLSTESADDGNQKLSFAALSLIAILTGRQPNTPPFAGPPYDTEFPSFPSCLAPPDSNSTNATVGCQAEIFIKYIEVLRGIILDIGNNFEDYANETRGNCSDCANSTSVLPLYYEWGNISIAINATLNVTNQTTLLQFVNATLGANLTIVFNDTQNLQNSLGQCAQCLINYVRDGHVKSISQCIFNGGVDSGSRGSGEGKKGVEKCFIKAGKKFRRVARGLTRRFTQKLKKHRKNHLIRLYSLFSSINSTVSNIFSTSRNYTLCITNGSITEVNAKNYTNIFAWLLGNFTINVNITITEAAANVSSALNSTLIALNQTAQNASQSFSDQANSFIVDVVNATELYPDCKNFSQSAEDLKAAVALNISVCTEGSQNTTLVVFANLTATLNMIGQTVTSLRSGFTNCSRYYCDSTYIFFIPLGLGLTSLQCLNRYGAQTKTRTCFEYFYGQVTSSLTADLYITGNVTITGSQQNATTVIEAQQNCTNAQNQIALVALADLRAQFESCKASSVTTTTPATTTPDTTTPAATVPDTTTTAATVPDTTTTAATVPDTTTTAATVPDTTTTAATVPDTTTPAATIPDTTTPAATIPDTTTTTVG